MKTLNNSKSEIKKLKKEIEKITNSLAGKDDKIKNSKKKELLSKYKNLFDNKLNEKNINVSEDLFNGALTIKDWYPEEKKIVKEYFKLAIKLAVTLDQIITLGDSFSTSGNYKLAKTVLTKGKNLANNFEEKWKLAEKFNQAREIEDAKKIGEDAISLLEDKKQIKEYKKELERITSAGYHFF